MVEEGFVLTKLKKKLAILLVGGGLLLTGGLVSAGTSYEYYTETVPRFNGTAYTDSQKKATSNKAADLQVSTIGKAMDARLWGTNANWIGPWKRVSTTGNYTLYNSVPAGEFPAVQFSNDLTTSVNVLIAGQWRSN